MKIDEILENIVYVTKRPIKQFILVLRTINLFFIPTILVFVFGFDHEPWVYGLLERLVWLSFALFVFVYLVRYLYADDRRDFIGDNWLEALLCIVLLVNFMLNQVAGRVIIDDIFVRLGLIREYEHSIFYDLATFLLLSIIAILEGVRAVSRFFVLAVKPSALFLLSFLLLIFLGTGLLLLPAMTVEGADFDVVDAFFTATSASCVTGLIVVDTATFFTWKGQVVIMILFQLGGLGIVSFATFFASIMRSRVGIKQQSALQSLLSSESLFDASKLLKQIVLLTLVIESVGAFIIYGLWPVSVPFEYNGQRFFFSVFHSISAFCNAGFALFTNSLNEQYVADAYVLHLVVAGLIILGSLGFSTLNDIFSPSAIRERIQKPWKNWNLNTRVAVHTSFALIVGGMVLIYMLEYNKLFHGLGFYRSMINAFFQSVTTRTAGFNTVDIAALSTTTLLLLILLMFIGASPGSTGGGIKTTTAWTLLVSSIATIRNKRYVEIGKRTLPNELIYKAFSVLFYSLIYNLICLLILTYTESDKELLAIIFEQISAFSTVGLSMGITSDLSVAGKVVIMATMFIGRVGTLTLALALSRPASSTEHKYANGYVQIG